MHLKQSRCSSDNHMTYFKMAFRADCAVSTCSPFPPPIRSWNSCFRNSCRWLSGESWPLDTSPSSSPVASFWNKANFPFHQSYLLSTDWSNKQLDPKFGNRVKITIKRFTLCVCAQLCPTLWDQFIYSVVLVSRIQKSDPVYINIVVV